MKLHLNPILLTYVFRDDSGLPFNHWLAEAQEYMRVRGTKDENIQVELAADMKRSEDNSRLFKIKEHMEALKPKGFGTSRVDIIGDTAFIYFEGFAETCNESAFYYHLPDKTSTMSAHLSSFMMPLQKSNKRRRSKE